MYLNGFCRLFLVKLYLDLNRYRRQLTQPNFYFFSCVESLTNRLFFLITRISDGQEVRMERAREEALLKYIITIQRSTRGWLRRRRVKVS